MKHSRILGAVVVAAWVGLIAACGSGESLTDPGVTPSGGNDTTGTGTPSISVSQVSPANGDTGVDPAASVIITFSSSVFLQYQWNNGLNLCTPR